MMDSSFGILDAFAFLVFAVLLFVAVIIIVSLGRLPGQLARNWGHPQAAAINALSWIGIATGGLLWPIAFVWAGGGWQIREDSYFVDAATTVRMRARTNWGDLLPPANRPQPPAPGLPGPENIGPAVRPPEW